MDGVRTLEDVDVYMYVCSIQGVSTQGCMYMCSKDGVRTLEGVRERERRMDRVRTLQGACLFERERRMDRDNRVGCVCMRRMDRVRILQGAWLCVYEGWIGSGRGRV